jgi:hypothetical protein
VIVASGSCSVVVVDCVEVLQIVSVVFHTQDAESSRSYTVKLVIL